MPADIRVYIEGYKSVFPPNSGDFPSRFQSLVTNYVKLYVDTTKPELLTYVPGTSGFVGNRVENLFYHYQPHDPAAMFEEYGTVLESLFEYGLDSTPEMDAYRETLRTPAPLRPSEIPNWLDPEDLPTWMWLPKWLWLDPDSDEVTTRDLPRGIEPEDLRNPAESIGDDALPSGVTPADVAAIREVLPEDRHPDEFPTLLDSLPPGIDISILETTWSRHESDETSILPWQLSRAKPDLPGLTRLYRRVLDEIIGSHSLKLGVEDVETATQIIAYIYKNDFETTVTIEDGGSTSGEGEITLVTGNQNFAPLDTSTSNILNEYTEQVRENWLEKLLQEAKKEIGVIINSDQEKRKRLSELIAVRNMIDRDDEPSLGSQSAEEIRDIYETVQADLPEEDQESFTTEIVSRLENEIDELTKEIQTEVEGELKEPLNELLGTTDNEDLIYRKLVTLEQLFQAKYSTEVNSREYEGAMAEMAEKWSKILRNTEYTKEIRDYIRKELLKLFSKHKDDYRTKVLDADIQRVKSALNRPSFQDPNAKIEYLHRTIDAIDEGEKLELIASRLSASTTRDLKTVYQKLHSDDYDEPFQNELASVIEEELDDQLYFTYYGHARTSIDGFVDETSNPREPLYKLKTWLENDAGEPDFQNTNLRNAVQMVRAARDDEYLSDRINNLEKRLINEIEDIFEDLQADYETRIKEIFTRLDTRYEHQYKVKRQHLSDIDRIIESEARASKDDFDDAIVRSFYDLWSEIQKTSEITNQRGDLENIARNELFERQENVKRNLRGHSVEDEEENSSWRSYFSPFNDRLIVGGIVLALLLGFIFGSVFIATTGLFVGAADEVNEDNVNDPIPDQHSTEITVPEPGAEVDPGNFTVEGNTEASQVSVSLYDSGGTELESETVTVENQTFDHTPDLDESGKYILEVTPENVTTQASADRRIVEVLGEEETEQ